MRAELMRQRQEARREALLDAGIELLGHPEGPAVTLRAVCSAAGLTQRYFYESFADRDAYVGAVFDHVASQAIGVILKAYTYAEGDLNSRAHAVIEAFTEMIVDHPAAGRVLVLAPFIEPALGRAGLARVPEFVDLVADGFDAYAEVDDRRTAAVAAIGALSSLYASYLDGTLTISRDKLVAGCVKSVLDAGRP
ncbi:TetR/AcrR family transcriptional regulator [Hoyosella subflava]|uniref:TetR family transcriptional regulator n=1 Tax=Hoyosella subflava (strain DSM 45089 / JCM 17490 / NBRC 109087 / DQS3-9A1) TaxID=443218 RepID=F6EI89_HOYSD|nr:TetR/AcrR family transcriptional regulator [Hoyosella subflava]AEF41196.1 TetR family transcriptional regulator [Hoyosella subflava DQS3-9A1]